MHRSWYWVLLILAGSLPLGSALQYYFAGEPYHNTPTRNWLVVGQALLGITVIAFGLIRQIKSARTPTVEQDEKVLDLNSD